MSYYNYKTNIINKLKHLGLNLIDNKSIAFGEILILQSEQINLKISLYYNKKNQYKFLLNKVEPEKYREQIINLLANNQVFSFSVSEEEQPVEYDFWAGSDESGKGDYFGPLVVACFACHKTEIPKLRKYGVKDSKLLTDEKIILLAEKIFLDYQGYYQYLTIMPEQYNKLYPQFSQHKPGLNEMLAWAHAKVITALYQKHKFPQVIIDKFADEKLIQHFVGSDNHLHLKIITKAEADTVVAVASIIARYLFVKKIDELSEKYHIQIIKGASPQVKQLRDSIDPELLPVLVKMHFK